MTTRVLLIHYTPPGVIGGVEHIMYQHARLLEERGYRVEVVAGREGEAGVPIHVIPELDAARPESKAVEGELDRGVVSPRYYSMRNSILQKLRPFAGEADYVIAHNAFTLQFNLPLTSVLWEIAGRRPAGSTISWSHDLAWTNPLYLPVLHPGYPWELLRLAAPRVTYVAISDERREQLAGLWGDGGQRIVTIPNGVDAAEFLRLPPRARSIVERYRLFERDLVLLLPVRITRRKNIEAAIAAVAVLKSRRYDLLFLVSGPQAPHHPGRSDRYLDELKALRHELGVDEEVVFLADELQENLDTETIFGLYAVADALIFPSRQEGFGLPIVEAGLARVPVVRAQIRILDEVGGDDTWSFPLDDEPDRIAGVILQAVSGKTARLYRRVLDEYRWDTIVDRRLLPLLQPRPGPESDRGAGIA